MNFMLPASCILLLFSSPIHAWTGGTHTLIAKESLKSVEKQWRLDEPILATPFDNFLKKLSLEKPEVQTREDFARWLKINPNSNFDSPRKDEKLGEMTTPYEILYLYSPRPDDNRDRYLPYDSLEQFWFGSGTKTVSQAFRHMEKPPFNLFHPLNTFGFPLGTIGQASQRAQIYFDLALTAHRLEEPYWAWNFLGCALHYIQDLGQPYHSSQFLPPSLLKGLRAYFHWGRKEKKGLIGTITHVISNVHHYFEGYVEYMIGAKPSIGTLWLDALKGEKLLAPSPSIRHLAKEVRDFSNRFSYDAIQATFQLTGKSLTGPRIYETDDEETHSIEDPMPFLNPDSAERNEAASQISKIVLENFTCQGKAMRTIVRTFLDQTQEK